MKNLIKRMLFRSGWNLSRVNVRSNAALQVVRSIEHCGANLVIDVGANRGQFVQELRGAGYAADVVSFEPLPDAHRDLIQAAVRDERWIVHERTAVGDSEGEIDINVSGNSVSSSVLPMLEAHASAAEGSSYVAVERVPVVRLDSVAHAFLAADSLPFIKIDTQGFEWQVLDGADLILRRAVGVMCELSLLPLYSGQRLWRELVDRLEAAGFELWAIQQGFTDADSGRSLQVDAIFLRPRERLESSVELP